MTEHLRYTLITLCLALTSLVFASAGQPAPPAPIPWFIEHMKIEPVSLPNGVKVEVVQRTDYGVSRDFIVVTNISPTPLYLTGKPMTGNATFEPSSVKLSAGNGPVLKIVSGQAFSWGPIFDTPNSSARMGWESGESYGRSDAVWLYIDTNRLWGDANIILELEPRNHFNFNGDRPVNVDLPEDQTISLPLVYGVQVINVPLTISYTLNTEYYSAQYFLGIVPGLQCVILVGALLTTIFLYRYWKRNRLNRHIA